MNSKKRPNQESLYKALNIYIDTMRPFIFSNLSTVERLLPKDRFQNEADIDIGDFSRLIRTYLNDAFKSHFDRYWDVCRAVDTINEARNKISHPGMEDVTIGNMLIRVSTKLQIYSGKSMLPYRSEK